MVTASDRPLALVTGSSSGIGWAYSERLAADGHDLVIVGRRGDRLNVLKELLEARNEVSVTPLVADLSTAAGMASVDAALEDPRLATVIDNAALAHYKPFLELPQAELTELVMLNALAPARLMRAALPAMVERGRGTVVSVASLLVYSGGADNPTLPRRAVYAATKSFLFTLVRVLASELTDTGVRLAGPRCARRRRRCRNRCAERRDECKPCSPLPPLIAFTPMSAAGFWSRRRAVPAPTVIRAPS